MNWQEQLQYARIAEAIAYIKTHFRQQPDLQEVAKKMNMSPAHFQRLFTEWVGTSPKKFLQYISIGHAKNILRNNQQATLFHTAFDTGLSSTSRLHDLFISIEGMTPAEYKHGGKNLLINYRFADSPFGPLLVASTPKGICFLSFEENEERAVEHLLAEFPQAGFQKKSDEIQQHALSIFQYDWNQLPQIKLHLRGTDFQLKVWESLLKIPRGKLSTYGSIAQQIGQPKASRAVGTAIGSNPVAFLIPCHRVIQSTGTFDGYRWGTIRKLAMIGWEGAKTANEQEEHGFISSGNRPTA